MDIYFCIGVIDLGFIGLLICDLLILGLILPIINKINKLTFFPVVDEIKVKIPVELSNNWPLPFKLNGLIW